MTYPGRSKQSLNFFRKAELIFEKVSFTIRMKRRLISGPNLFPMGLIFHLQYDIAALK
jgi:hypothetical protein